MNILCILMTKSVVSIRSFCVGVLNIGIFEEVRHGARRIFWMVWIYKNSGFAGWPADLGIF